MSSLELFRTLAKRYREREARMRENAEGCQTIEEASGRAYCQGEASAHGTAASDLEQLIRQLDKPASGEVRVMTKWYNRAREQDYQNLYERSGVGTIEDALDIEHREALKETLDGKMIEARYAMRKAFSPLLDGLGLVDDE